MINMPSYHDLSESEKYFKFKFKLYKILKGSDFDADQYVNETDVSILKLVMELKEENLYLKNKVKELEQQLDCLEQDKSKEVYELKVQLGKEKSQWKIRGNSASRWKLENDKIRFEPCILPLDFDINKMDVNSFDENGTKMWYSYPKESVKQEKYWMYTELYDFLSGKKKSANLDVHNVKTLEDMKDYIYSIGDVPRGRHIEKTGRFIIKKRFGSGEFTADELDKEVGFKNRKTRRDYCKKFIKWEFIDETKTEGVYKIIF